MMDELFQIALSEEVHRLDVTIEVDQVSEETLHLDCVKLISQILTIHVRLEEVKYYKRMRYHLRTQEVHNFLVSDDPEFGYGIHNLEHPLLLNLAAIVKNYLKLEKDWNLRINYLNELLVSIQTYVSCFLTNGSKAQKLKDFQPEMINAYWMVTEMVRVIADAHKVRKTKWVMALYYLLETPKLTDEERVDNAKRFIDEEEAVPRWWLKYYHNRQFLAAVEPPMLTNQTRNMLNCVIRVNKLWEELGSDKNFLDMYSRLGSSGIEKLLGSYDPEIPPDVPNMDAPVIQNAAHIIYNYREISTDIVEEINQLNENVDRFVKYYVRCGDHSRLHWLRLMRDPFTTIYWKIMILNQAFSEAEDIIRMHWARVAYYLIRGEGDSEEENRGLAQNDIKHIEDVWGLPQWLQFV